MLDDAAQSFGATYKGRRLGALADATATSFFPAKPLGCYGDGGAIFTDDDELADTIQSLRVHGQGTDKYDNTRIGLTGRLDSIQAAVLLEKLAIFPDEIDARHEIAQRYARVSPMSPPCRASLKAIGRCGRSTRSASNSASATELAAALKADGIPTAIYYPKPLHWQTAYRNFPVADGGLAVSERLAAEVISLPMHPYLDPATQDRIIDGAPGIAELSLARGGRLGDFARARPIASAQA